MDAIECGILKLPRVPVADNLPSAPSPLYRKPLPTIRSRMPKKSRGEARPNPAKLPIELQTTPRGALRSLRQDLRSLGTRRRRRAAGLIVVCNNTTNSELVAEYIAGYERETAEGVLDFYQGRLELFRNFTDDGQRLARSRTLLIDSQQIEHLIAHTRRAANERLKVHLFPQAKDIVRPGGRGWSTGAFPAGARA